MRFHSIFVAVGWVLLGTMISGAARGEVVLGTEAEGNGGYGVGFSFESNTNLVIGQAFTLNQAVELSSITVFVNGNESEDPQGSFNLTLTDLIGSSAGSANVLFTDSGIFHTSAAGEHDPVVFSAPLALQPGTYYIVLSSDASGSGWGTNAQLLPGSVGTVDYSYVGFVFGGGVGNYQSLDPDNPNTENYANFQLNAVPEPALLGWLAPTVLMMVGRRAHLKRRSEPSSPLMK